jgi:amino acid transporter
VVGSGGLARALGILALATSISLLTSLSLAAIATNRKVRGGGDYYLISRSLGAAYGGALGLVLFVAQAVSVAFYCVGFGEALARAVPGVEETQAAAGAAALLLALAWLGADLATRFQYAIMAVLGAGLVSFFVGAAGEFEVARLRESWAAPDVAPPFWALFAIFFPAVTGFTQGVSMSGDLKEPAKSLPRGTFLAVGLSTVVYVLAMLAFAGAAPRGALADDPAVMDRLAAVGPLVAAGVVAATISSALASFLGAPRILQALATDRIFDRLAFFAAGAGPTRNPRRAVLLTGAIAFAVIAAGNLNAIARVVSMFFLISYGLLNYATYVEATAASPSFRPRFRFFHRRVSLAGTFLCAGVMFAIDAFAAVAASAVLVAIHQFLTRTTVPMHWRDSRRAYRFRRVKDGLREIAGQPEGPRDWQPHILAFTESAERRGRTLEFASRIAGGSGIVTAVQIIEGEGAFESARARRAEAEEALRRELEEGELDAFPLVVAAQDLRQAAATLVQSWGIGPIQANTVLLNWYEGFQDNSTASLWYSRLLSGTIALERNLVVLHSEQEAWDRTVARPSEERTIDVWWWDDASSRLALLLAYLMTRTETWDHATLRLLAPATAKDEDRVRKNVEHRLEEIRIDAALEVVVDAGADTLVERSAESDLVILPFRVQGMQVLDPFGEPAAALLAKLRLVAMVAAGEDIRLREREEPPEPEEAVEPEEAASDAEAPADEGDGADGAKPRDDDAG